MQKLFADIKKPGDGRAWVLHDKARQKAGLPVNPVLRERSGVMDQRSEARPLRICTREPSRMPARSLWVVIAVRPSFMRT